jgi:hypothetical protein
MLAVSLDCPFFFAPSVFSKIYLSCVLCTLCCQFLWSVLLIAPSVFSNIYLFYVCLPYVASLSGLSFFFAPSAFSKMYLSCVLCTLCCQFLWSVLLIALRYSLTFICSMFCLHYVASFSGLPFFNCPFGIL